MHLEFFVEEPSAEAALRNLASAILGKDTSFQIHPFQGKRDLLGNLPGRLRSMAKWLPAEYCVVVLADNDNNDCHQLKERMERISRDAGLTSKSSARNGPFNLLNRLAIEELEAWFLGDPVAIAAAYPGINANLARKRNFRDPDAVKGGTWEALHRALRSAGYFPGSFPKIEAAREISRYMEPSRNTSRSFQVFRDGLMAFRALCAG